MVFSSSVFLFLFLPLTLAGYFLVKIEWRNLFLLLASLAFYAWGETVYSLIMLTSIGINYTFGLLIDKQRQNKAEKITDKFVLSLGVSCNLCLLVYFKYAKFLLDNANFLLIKFGLNQIIFPPVHLPIGISFFTFQAISYLVDVYRQKSKVQTNFINCGLYIALFPQLIAGPIVRYHDVAKQIESRKITISCFSLGIQRFVIGLGKKMIIANSLGEVADRIFASQISEVTAGMGWIGLACYTLQIYFDFSGYSDMAIGLGRMFGFKFLENFNYPYISQSIREFWQRWHISLSSWFRDYLYIPLGGNRVSSRRTYLNLWVVFLLCGIWHGASWNFLIWGVLHGFYLIVERLGGGIFTSCFWRPIKHVYTLLLVMIAWVFFRAETLDYALEYLSRIFWLTKATGIKYDAFLFCDPKTVSLLFLGCLFATPIAQTTVSQVNKIYHASQSHVLKYSATVSYYLILAGIFFLSVIHIAANTYNPFIYFRF